MKPRHEIDAKYGSNPRHIRRWKLTIEWLKQFDIRGDCLDCGDRTNFTRMIEEEFPVKIENTTHDLNYIDYTYPEGCNNIFAFEVIEHLLNPLSFMSFVWEHIKDNGSIYLSTPIFRPKWMRNKELHFHEFN